MALTFKNLSGGSGTSTTTTRVYTLPLTETSWVRIAKVPVVSKNSSGIFSFDCYGVKEDGTNEILTTSVFSVSCGLDNNGKFVSDVLPINQAPELTSSDGSGSDGGASGSGDAPSGSGDDSGSGETGSGRTGVHGLASIKLENFEGETYVCALINYPTVEKYTMLTADMRIENNLNFEMLDSLEVVNLDEVIYGADQVVSEGTVIKADEDYEFRVRCKLSDYRNVVLNYAVDNGTPYDAFSIELENTLENGDPKFVNLIWLDSDGNGVNNGETVATGSTYYYPNLFLTVDHSYFNEGGEATLTMNDDILSYVLYNILGREEKYYSTKITKMSGTISLRKAAEEMPPIYLEVNGEKVLENFEDGETQTYYIENLTPYKDNVIVKGEGGAMECNFIFDLENTEIEIAIPYKVIEEQTIQSIRIANEDVINLSLVLKDVTKHETSKSYDLFSPYALLQQVSKHSIYLKSMRDSLNDLKYNDVYRLKEQLSSLNITDLNKVSASFSMKEIPENFLAHNIAIDYGYYPVTEKIGNSAFEQSTIKYINLPKCKEIGNSAFFNSSIIKCDLGDNLETIKSQAFSLSLKYIIIPPSVTYIEENIIDVHHSIAFVSWSEEEYQNGSKPFISQTIYYNTTKEDLIEENHCIYVDNGDSYTLATADAYYFYTEQTDAFLPFAIYGKPVTKIGNSAFKKVNITDIEIPDSVEEIGDYAFYRCSGIFEQISSNATKIGNYAFSNIGNLKCVYLTNANYLESYVFYYDYVLTEVHLGNITKFKVGTFWGCPRLSDVYISSNELVGLQEKNAFQEAGNDNDNNGVINIHVRPEVADLYYTAEHWIDLINEGRINIIGDYEG